jgi:hypothetical protein
MVRKQYFEQRNTPAVLGKRVADAEVGCVAQFTFHCLARASATGARNIVFGSIGEDSQFFFNALKVHC